MKAGTGIVLCLVAGACLYRCQGTEADPVRAQGQLGDAALEAGDYGAAAEHYQKMMDLRPDLASYRRAAELVFLRGDLRKAMWLMQKAIDAGAPDSEETKAARARLALMLWGSGALLPAEKMLETALRDAPRNPDLLAAMGRIQTSRKDYAAAIEHYERAISVAPRQETIVALGDLYALTGRAEEAEEEFARVGRSEEPDPLQMARFYADHDRNLEEAVSMAEEAYEIRPNVFTADTLAWCYYKNGRYRDAQKIMDVALSQKTPDASFLFHAGMIRAKSGDGAGARKFLYQALSLNPGFHPVDAQVAVDTLERLGNREGF